MARRPEFVATFAPEAVEHLDSIELKYHRLIQSTEVLAIGVKVRNRLFFGGEEFET